MGVYCRRAGLKSHKRSHVYNVDLDYATYGITTCHEFVNIFRSAEHVRRIPGDRQVVPVAGGTHDVMFVLKTVRALPTTFVLLTNEFNSELLQAVTILERGSRHHVCIYVTAMAIPFGISLGNC